MYWIMLSERDNEYQYSHDETPPQIEQYGWEFDNGQLVTNPIPLIQVSITPHSEEVLTDNIPAYGCAGLLVNQRVKAVFDGLGLQNMQYFPVKLIINGQAADHLTYWIANIIGSVGCIDKDASNLTLDPEGDIEFIESLTLKTDNNYGHIFRLAEYLPVMAISSALKEALEGAKITGLMFYKPEEFSL